MSQPITQSSLVLTVLLPQSSVMLRPHVCSLTLFLQSTRVLHACLQSLALLLPSAPGLPASILWLPNLCLVTRWEPSAPHLSPDPASVAALLFPVLRDIIPSLSSVAGLRQLPAEHTGSVGTAARACPGPCSPFCLFPTCRRNSCTLRVVHSVACPRRKFSQRWPISSVVRRTCCQSSDSSCLRQSGLW